METYLKRTYRQRMAKAKMASASEEEQSFPFWDYRSRRGSLSTSNSGTSSSGASSYDGCSLSSLSSIRSADSASINSSVSSSDSESVVMVTSDPYRLQMQFHVDTPEVLPLTELYKSLTEWVDEDLHIFKVNERQNFGNCNQSFCTSKPFSRMPSVAVMLFLAEDGPLGYERIQAAKRRFEKPPWKFHHSEHMTQGKLNLYPYNSPDYYYTSEELPLWAVRLVHCGKEYIRIVLFSSDEFWEDMVQFYRLVIGVDPDVNKDDFCLFTVHTHGRYDVQFALKRLKGETKPRVLESVKLQFKVPDVGSLVPLFPNVCKPISDKTWQTSDHDGNVIIIDVIDKTRPTSSTPLKETISSSRSSRKSSRSSVKSSNSVQSLTSVTSSLSSSTSSTTSSSMTSVSSATSEMKGTLTERCRDAEQEDETPPKLPPRIPRVKTQPPELPEQPIECFAGLRGFYV